MMEKEVAFELSNLELDIFSSIMLDDLKDQLKCRDGIELTSEEQSIFDGKKCALTTAVSFAISVGAGVLSGIIIELVKSVYARHNHPKEYEWKILLRADESLNIIVYQKNGVVLTDCQKVTKINSCER